MTSIRQLAGRTALVTGASSGLGRRFANVIADAGARTVVAARRADRLADLVAEIEAAGGQAMAVSCDVTVEADVIRAFDAATERFGVVNTVVNNAGMSTSASSLEQDVSEFADVMALNVTSVFTVARQCVKRLVAAGPEASTYGRIVNIASIGAHKVQPGVAAYCASKAAVVMLTKSLARDWARYGVNVNAISPGYLETDLNSDWLRGDAGTKMLDRTPRRRIMAPDSLDAALLYLLSDASAATTGANLVVDDGQSL